MTTFAYVDIHTGADPSIDYKGSMMRAEITRSVNAVGNWSIIMRNTTGAYNTTFDVQDYFRLDVDNIGDTLIEGRVDGPAVNLIGRDLESIWDEYIVVKGVDNGQDMLFHNDFVKEYPNRAQLFDDILDDAINVQLVGLTNIGYSPVAGTPLIGSFEFREGANFLSQIQELHRRVDYIFYVEDNLTLGKYMLISKPAVIPIVVPPPSTYTSITGDATNNILGGVEYQTRDGDKHYNYIRLYGKSPMFDGYTEQNAYQVGPPVIPGWVPDSFIAPSSTVGVLDDTSTVKWGTYSLVAYNENPVRSMIGMEINTSAPTPLWNYPSWDLHQGEINVWARYDNNAGAPGNPGAGAALTDAYLYCILNDSSGNQLLYYGASSNILIDEWMPCVFPLGADKAWGWPGYNIDTWTRTGGPGTFNWESVTKIDFILGDLTGGNAPSHLYIDGLILPFPILAIEEAPAEQALYRKRPYIDCWSHIKTQNAIDNCAVQLLQQTGTTLINKISFMTPGTKNLRYAGQRITVNIPSLGINAGNFYITKLHHIIEPRMDVSKGYGFDWVTEIEALPTNGTAYDHNRLGIGSLYTPTQKISRLGAGVR